MTVTLEAPVLAGSRPRAQRILASLPADLTGQIVQLHCGSLIAAAASFADEIVRTILVDRHAKALEVTSVSDQEFIDYLRERAEVIRTRELERAASRMSLADDQRDQLEALTRSIVNKLLHSPLARLRAVSGHEEGLAMIESARVLFGLNDQDTSAGA